MSYLDKTTQKRIIKKYKGTLPLDICVVTCDRLIYLQKCIWSIIASTSVPYRIFVIDDNSKDGSVEWLKDMKDRELIYNVTYNKKNMGTAWNFNHVINKTKSSFFVMANDDIYFYRSWDYATLNAINKFSDCGIVTFFNWYVGFNRVDEKVIDSETMHLSKTGMAGAVVRRELFKDVNGFFLPPGEKMGFFATPFCKKVQKSKLKQKQHYALKPYYAYHMDLPKSKLCERDQLKKYTIMRRKHKKGTKA